MTIPTHKCDISSWLANHPLKARLEVRLPTELLQAVRELADANDWELSYAVRYSIMLGLRQC